jgi:hypothetical protein
MTGSHKRWFWVLLGGVALVYAPSLSSGFYAEEIIEFLKPGYCRATVPQRFAYVLWAKAFGAGYQHWETPFRVMLIAAHLVAVWAVYRIAVILTGSAKGALVGAAVFGISYVNREAVLRLYPGTVGSAMPVMLAVLAALEYAAKPRWWLLVVAPITAFVGTGFKEYGMIAPLVIAGMAVPYRSIAPERCKRVLVAAGCCAAGVAASLPWALQSTGTHNVRAAYVGWHTVKQVLSGWVFLGITPWYQALHFVGLPTLVSGAAAAIVAVAIAVVAVRGIPKEPTRRGRWAWSLALLATTTLAFMPPASQALQVAVALPVMTSRYFYLPSAFFGVLVALWVGHLFGMRKWRPYALAVLGAMLLVNAVLIQREERRWGETTRLQEAVFALARDASSDFSIPLDIYLVGQPRTHADKELSPLGIIDYPPECLPEMIEARSGYRLQGEVQLLSHSENMSLPHRDREVVYIDLGSLAARKAAGGPARDAAADNAVTPR